MNEIQKKLVGKTVLFMDVDGYGITIEFTDGTVFNYMATDGGYSSWEIDEAER